MVAFWSSLVHTLQLTILTIPFLRVSDDSKLIVTPASCLKSSTTIDALVTCLRIFLVPPQYYNKETYEAAQPTSNQRDDWKNLVYSLVSVNDGDCSSIPIPPSLQGIYAIETFNTMCVLYEISCLEGIYIKGWGFMIVPRLRTSVSRTVHFSAPHPGYDLGTIQQAAFLFESTGSKSLLVPGRARTAFSEPSECISMVFPLQAYCKTDTAHNVVRNKLFIFFRSRVTWFNDMGAIIDRTLFRCQSGNIRMAATKLRMSFVIMRFYPDPWQGTNNVP